MERQVGPPGVGRLAELIRGSRSTVALTGAGISVPSGIPDFRTPETGLWAKVDPMEVAHIEVFERDPERFWSYYRPRFNSLGDKRPNRAVEGLFDERGVAICASCGGAVKPDAVLFGELLPEPAVAQATELAEAAELMLCVGSSLVVYPVADLPRLTLEHGGELAIVTKGETPYDGAATVKLEGEVDAELERLLVLLD